MSCWEDNEARSGGQRGAARRARERRRSRARRCCCSLQTYLVGPPVVASRRKAALVCLNLPSFEREPVVTSSKAEHLVGGAGVRQGWVGFSRRAERAKRSLAKGDGKGWRMRGVARVQEPTRVVEMGRGVRRRGWIRRESKEREGLGRTGALRRASCARRGRGGGCTILSRSG